jgi:deoxyribodipyrimidine photo-lyase
MESRVPQIRIETCNEAPINTRGDYVLHWMVAFRRTTWNFSLQRAAEWAAELQKPLIVLEALRCGHPWASDRLHQFILDGMADNTRRLADRGVLHYAYVEPDAQAGKGLLAALAAHAAVVVTDDFPCFMLPHMLAAGARQVPVRMEKVDANGLLPMRTATQVFPSAHTFRRFLQRNLAAHLVSLPAPNPLARRRFPPFTGRLTAIRQRWPLATPAMLQGGRAALAPLPIDHSVAAIETRGGTAAAEAALQRFLTQRLRQYPTERNQPEKEVSSGLSPYLHFGHIAAHQVLSDLLEAEGKSVADLTPDGSGSRSGWRGVSPAARAFIDELVTWREIGFNMCWQRDDYDRYESLPAWAQATLGTHARDPRTHVYGLEQFESAHTHDPLWNAAQVQLVREGRLHNYLRMLWGKKILEWSANPSDALAVMIELNNKYALDGRNPNSYTGIFWVLGRYDRPWGPERPIFGKVRYMSSENTARKLRVTEFIRRYAPTVP